MASNFRKQFYAKTCYVTRVLFVSRYPPQRLMFYINFVGSLLRMTLLDSPYLILCHLLSPSKLVLLCVFVCSTLAISSCVVFYAFVDVTNALALLDGSLEHCLSGFGIFTSNSLVRALRAQVGHFSRGILHLRRMAYMRAAASWGLCGLNVFERGLFLDATEVGSTLARCADHFSARRSMAIVHESVLFLVGRGGGV